MFKTFIASLLAMTIAQASPERIVQLKGEIQRIALDNITNVNNRKEIRAQLDVLIQELQSLSDPVDEATWVIYAPGSWQQIWSDEKDMSPPGSPQQNLKQIYQYVSVEGWGFNYGERIIKSNQAVTFALAVQGSVAGNEQTTEITKAYFKSGGLNLGESILSLSESIRDGTNSDFAVRDAGKFPNGPIGAKGVLSLKFLDEDLKLGYTPNVYTGEIELFVMKRVEGVQK